MYFIIFQDETFLEAWGSNQLIVLNEYKMISDQNTCYLGECKSGSYPINHRCYMSGKRSSQWQADGTPQNHNDCTTNRLCRGRVEGCWTIMNYEQCIMVINRYIRVIDDKPMFINDNLQ